LREPFDVLNEAYRRYETRQARTYQRRVPVVANEQSATVVADAFMIAIP
jgi:hypothetical protein